LSVELYFKLEIWRYNLQNKNLSLSENIKLIRSLQQKQLDTLKNCVEIISKIKGGTEKASESLTNMKVILNG